MKKDKTKIIIGICVSIVVVFNIILCWFMISIAIKSMEPPKTDSKEYTFAYIIMRRIYV